MQNKKLQLRKRVVYKCKTELPTASAADKRENKASPSMPTVTIISIISFAPNEQL